MRLWLLLAALLLPLPLAAQDMPYPPGTPPDDTEFVTTIPSPGPGLPAGTAYPVFAAGQVLTAAQLNAALAAPIINGGQIDGAPIGGFNPQTGRFSTLRSVGAFQQDAGTTVIAGSSNFQVGDNTALKRSIFNSYITPASGVLNAPFMVQGNAFGTITSAASVANMRAFNVNSDTIDATLAQGGGLNWNYFGGTISSGAKGGRNGLSVFMNHVGPSTAGNLFYVAGAIFNQSTGSAGGVVGTPAGNLFGFNNSALLKTGSGLYWNSVVGQEVNVGAQTGTGVQDKVGLQIVQWSTDAVAASRTEVGLLFAAQTAAQVTGWKQAIAFGANHGSWPMHPTGTLIGLGQQNASLPARYPVVVARGIDFASIPAKFTTSALATPGFLVDGTGLVTLGPNQLTWSVDGMELAAKGKRATLASIAAAGTAYRATDIVRDDQGGLYEVATVNGGGGITALTVIKNPTLASGAAPSNPRTLSGGMGANGTVNLTWSDAAYVSVDATQAFRVMDNTGVSALFTVDIGSSFANLAGDLTVTGSTTSTSYLVGANQVVGGRRTGWAAATGTATRTTFATTTVTTQQLAERVKALIDDLTTHGLIGP